MKDRNSDREKTTEEAPRGEEIGQPRAMKKPRGIFSTFPSACLFDSKSHLSKYGNNDNQQIDQHKGKSRGGSCNRPCSCGLCRLDGLLMLSFAPQRVHLCGFNDRHNTKRHTAEYRRENGPHQIVVGFLNVCFTHKIKFLGCRFAPQRRSL